MPSIWTKVAIAIVAVVAGTVFAAASISAVVERSNPQLATRIMPLNGLAKSREADISFVLARLAQDDGDRSGSDRLLSKARALARQALASVPLNPKALRIVALSGNDPEEKRELLNASNAQSRRDSLAQIMLIEQSARSGRVEEALTHYDALLRRDTGYRDIAGRQLALATADPKLASEVARLLRKTPPWRSLYYYYATREPKGFDGFISIHHALQGTGEIPIETSAAFAEALVDAGRIDDALEIARMRNAPVLKPANSLTETSFTLAPTFPGAWILSNDAATSLQPLREGGAFLGVSRGTVGVVASRLTALTPGNYRVSIAIENPDASYTSDQPGPALQGLVKCAGDASKGAGSSTFAVGADCPYQWLSIYLPGSANLDGELYISSIKVRRID